MSYAVVESAPGLKEPDARVRARLDVLDAVSMAVLSLALLVLSYLQARGRMFWNDEIVGDYLLHAGSLSRFWLMWRVGVDSSGLWFYVLAKPWEAIFGPSELSLRMFSAAGVVGGMLLLWIVARRFYSWAATALAIYAVFLDVGVLRWQLSNGRCYGLFLASAALVLFVIARGDGPDGGAEERRGGPWSLALTCIAYGLLAGAHLLGSVYAAVFLAAHVAVDVRWRRVRPVSYIAAGLSILAVTLLSLANIHSTMNMGKPIFWTAHPPIASLLLLGPTTDTAVRRLILGVGLIALLHVRRRRRRDTVYILFAAAVVLHTALFAVSRIGTSIYADRYLLPLTLPLALFLAELLEQLRESPAVGPVSFAWGAAVVVALILRWSPRPEHFPLPQPDYTTAMLADIPPGLPVVDADPGTFMEIEFYHHGRMPQPFLFPFDKDVATDPTSVGGVTGSNLLRAFNSVGLDVGDIQPTEAVLSRYNHFILLTAAEPTSWMRRRILSDPRYRTSDLGIKVHVGAAVHMWEISKERPCSVAGQGLR